MKFALIVFAALGMIALSFFFGVFFNYYLAFPLAGIKANIDQAFKFGIISAFFALTLQIVVATVKVIFANKR